MSERASAGIASSGEGTAGSACSSPGFVGRVTDGVDADAGASPALAEDSEGAEDDEHPADRRISAARTLE